jgi:hypothetical protein
MELPKIADGDGSGSSDGPGLLALLPQLKELDLQQCNVHSAHCLLCLASKTMLTSLKMERVTFRYKGGADPGMCYLLEQLQSLVQLRVFDMYTHKKHGGLTSLQPMATMQHIQDLELELEGADTSACLLQSLTRLRLAGKYTHEKFLQLQPSQLSNVRELDLYECNVTCAFLEKSTQLQKMALKRCHLHPAGLASVLQLKQLRLEKVTLLEYPRELQQLTCLQSLEVIEGSRGSYKLPVSMEMCAGFTASPQLTRLQLSKASFLWLNCDDTSAVDYIFPAHKQLPGLRELQLQFSYNKQYRYTCLQIDSEELSSIIRCCSGLRKLVVTGIIHEITDVSPLLQLPRSCKHLVVSGAAFTDTAVATVLVQLTQLTCLELTSAPLTCVGLDSLSALTKLKTLDLVQCSAMTQKDDRKSAGWLKLQGDKDKVSLS